MIIRLIIPVVFIIKLDWSVCTCLTQLYDGRDMYFYTYLCCHIVVLDKYIHSNLVL